MKQAIIITATRGLGIKLANISRQFNVESKTYAVTHAGVGESSSLPAYTTDMIIDINDPNSIEKITGNFDYLFWYTGVFLQKSLSEVTDFELDTLIDLHYRVPLKIIRNLHKQTQKPYHLIVVASCSSWRMRQNESVYCGLCAAKAAFTRNFANDLTNEFPGSKVTLVNPGGLRTPFFYEEKEIANIDDYLDQEHLAKFIWKTAIEQDIVFQEIQFLRNKSTVKNTKEPIIEFGTKCPEILIC